MKLGYYSLLLAGRYSASSDVSRAGKNKTFFILSSVLSERDIRCRVHSDD